MGIKGLTKLLQSCWTLKPTKDTSTFVDGNGIYYDILYDDNIFKDNEDRINLKNIYYIFKSYLQKLAKKYNIRKIFLDGFKEPIKKNTHKERLLENYSKKVFIHPLSSLYFSLAVKKVFGNDVLKIAEFEADPEIMKWLDYAEENKHLVNIISCDSDFYKYVPSKYVSIINHEGLTLDFAKIKSLLNDNYIDKYEWNYALKQFSNDYQTTKLYLNKTNIIKQINKYRKCNIQKPKNQKKTKTKTKKIKNNLRSFWNQLIISNELWVNSRKFAQISYMGMDIRAKLAYYLTRKPNFKLIRINKDTHQYEEIIVPTICWKPQKNDKYLSIETLFDITLDKKLNKKIMFKQLKNKIKEKWQCNDLELTEFDVYLEVLFKILKIKSDILCLIY